MINVLLSESSLDGSLKKINKREGEKGMTIDWDIIRQKREYSELTAREKDALKTYIVNTLKGFRERNITAIERDFQLKNQDGLREIWQSVAIFAIGEE